MQDECSIVMYHYIREKHYPKVYAININNFKSQINYLNKHYNIVSLQDYVSFLNNEKELKGKLCVLTFDDGLIDHYKIYKILKRLSLPATFFVPVLPLETKKILPTQMLQSLLATVDPNMLIGEYHYNLERFYPESCDEYLVTNTKQKQACLYPDGWYDQNVINLKCAIGRMNSKMKTELLEPLFFKYIGSYKEFYDAFYMTWDNVKELSENGFEIGSHGLTHTVLTLMNKKELQSEFYESKKIIEKNINTKIQSFCAPYGSHNAQVIKELKKCYNCSLRSTPFKINYGKPDPFELKRMDTLLIPGR